jgi:hypothetical protein
MYAKEIFTYLSVLHRRGALAINTIWDSSTSRSAFITELGSSCKMAVHNASCVTMVLYMGIHYSIAIENHASQA